MKITFLLVLTAFLTGLNAIADSCEGEQNVLIFEGRFPEVVQLTKPIFNSRREIIGFEGLTHNRQFIFQRGGDGRDGNIEEVGRAFEVNRYPHHFMWAKAFQEEVYAFGGTFTVHSVWPIYRASFQFTNLSLADKKGPPNLSGTRTGCLIFSY